ncbi:MAG: RnfABCDGE type electron transport complex subunit D [Candidatus Izemoplasmatales bacterium]|jgi:electron transport complex protein RnfD|nr:RnfABCDGE type electron transport complex subunit D [Candidatus Izemoplasmatales bacterium]MDD4595793.1 RnfABCDGE type electron transport complex subunit D [Candidatus Izemoplasmatales bacterium]
MARFANGKAPFLRKTDDLTYGTQVIMRDFLIGLIPLILFAWYKNGIKVYVEGNATLLEMFYPIIFIMLGGLISMVIEGLFFIITDKEVRTLKVMMKKLQLSYAMIPGILLAMILPLYTPIWVLIFGCIMATFVTKLLFGGFGYNIFNPALIGYVAIAFTLMGVINKAGGVLNGSEVLIDAIAGATPLSTLSTTNLLSYQTLVAPYGSLWNFFIGTIPGALAETSALACIISFVWLSARKVIKWFVPVIYIGTVFGLSWLIGIFNGQAGIWFPTFSILSGGLMFGAVFMATEPVTTPKNPLGKIVFALFLGVFTVLFRFIGQYPEGVATSIIFMNIFTMPIDKWTSVIRTQGVTKKTIIKIIILAILIIAIATYALIKANSIYSASIGLPLYIGGWN